MNIIRKIYHSFSSHLLSGNNRREQIKHIEDTLFKYARMPISEVFQTLNTNSKGLLDSDAKKRIETFGLNQIAHEETPQWYILLLRNFTNPFNLLLIFLAIVSFFIGETDAVYIISVMILLSVIVRFIQEYRSSKAAEKLKALVSTKATVLRRNNETEEPQKIDIAIKNLVPGDIVYLSAGDMLPGDVRLISAKDVYISQRASTGESLPVEKEISVKSVKSVDSENPIEMSNMCYVGTDVLNGSALAVVVATGNQTYFGSMAKSITGYRPLTSFDIGVNKVSWLLIRFIFVMVPIVFFLNWFTKGSWLDPFYSPFQ